MYLRRCDICGYTEELDESYFDPKELARWGKPKEKEITEYKLSIEKDKKGLPISKKIDLCPKCFKTIEDAVHSATYDTYKKLIEENK